MREKPLAFLSLVKVLETAVGNQTGYNLLDPFPCVTLEEGKPAYLPIQRAGRVIAQHVGLNGLTFIVAVTTHQPDTAGHIELRYDSSEVFVEVSQDICSFKDAVLATLCHEISHKFLHVRKIKDGFVQLEQELLTDVAAVYLGMGKIMLNGCECERTCRVTTNGRTTTTTHKLKTGYVTKTRELPTHNPLSSLAIPLCPARRPQKRILI